MISHYFDLILMLTTMTRSLECSKTSSRNKKQTLLSQHLNSSNSHRLYTGPSCTICQFWLFAGQCKSIADKRKLLYIFGSKVAICVGDEFD